MTYLNLVEKENQRLKEELTQLQNQLENLQSTLNKITSARAFKLWQLYNNLIKKPIKRIYLFLINNKNEELLFLKDKFFRILDLFFKRELLIIQYKIKNLFEKKIQIPYFESSKKNFSIKTLKDKKVDVIIPWYGDLRIVPLIKEIISDSIFLNKLIIINDCYPNLEINSKLENLILKLKNKKIIYLKNRKNLGFVQTCNKGMKLAKNDVILLNSDTMISKNWIKKLLKIAYSKKNIASVTPLSNNATIFSFPKFNTPNKPTENPTNISNLLEKITPIDYIKVPTMHGFCCFIKRQYLKKFGFFDEIFGKGYGEENDLSLRFQKNGLIDVVALNTYIIHYETKSFTTKKRLALINNHLQIINKRYPHYLKNVYTFLDKKPFNFLSELYFLFKNKPFLLSKNANLVILHTNPFETIGGVEIETLKLIKKISKQSDSLIILFYYDYQKLKYEITLINKNKIIKIINFENTINNSQYILKYILNTFKIKNIIIEHLKNHNFKEYFQILYNFKGRKILFIHDYFFIHPKHPQPLLSSKEFISLFDNRKINNNNLKTEVFDFIIFSSDMLKDIYFKKFNINDETNKFLIYYPL